MGHRYTSRTQEEAEEERESNSDTSGSHDPKRRRELEVTRYACLEETEHHANLTGVMARKSNYENR
ncbi:hypothetical protein E2C01_058569 [Portunus trituberculatus]|uniref:Uncharacterized protein n=1 Tax=Portunus trituberculatus TaxID=210409 RepID=A0A5B7H323_PORTR|nr:hypothetical protein [Portunus trituberculatus]